MKRLACLLPTLAGGRFSIVKPSPYALNGITDDTKTTNKATQIIVSSLLEINHIQMKTVRRCYLILSQIFTNDIND